MKILKIIFPLSIAVLSILLSSCDKQKTNPLDTSVTQPLVSWVSVTPNTVNTDTILVNGHVLPTDLITIHATVEARVSDPLGTSDIQAVTYQIYTPGSPTLITQGQLIASTPPVDSSILPTEAYFAATITFRIQRVQVGNFSVYVNAVNRAGTASNSSAERISLRRSSRAPILFNLVAPDTITLPQRPYFIVFTLEVSATDSDGLADIQSVYFRNISSTTDSNTHYNLYDDGVQSGQQYDSLANDGIFSGKFSLPWSQPPMTYNFKFEAVDQLGNVSNPIVHSIVVQR